MDENKDLLNSEPEAENETNTYLDPADYEKTVSLDYSGEFQDELEETGAVDSTETQTAVQPEQSAPKKKKLVQLPVIICGAIVVLFLLGFGVFKCFFNTSIVGEWKLPSQTASPDQPTTATSDEPAPIYVFDDDGSFYCQIGTTKQISNYSVEQNKETGDMTVTIDAMSSTFAYKVSGNIFTGRKLEFYDSTQAITDKSEPILKFESTSLNIPKLEKFENFKTNDKLIGKWHYGDGMFTDITITFNEDGTFIENNADVSIVEYVYTVTDNKIKLKYLYGKEETIELPYKLDGDTLYLNNNIPYQRVTGDSEKTQTTVASSLG